MWPDKPDAVNPAMALWFAIEHQWRRVTDLERSESIRGFTGMGGWQDDEGKIMDVSIPSFCPHYFAEIRLEWSSARCVFCGLWFCLR